LENEGIMSPDDILTIYELEGTPTDAEEFFGEHFLAYWREGDSSFLFFSEPQEALLKSFLQARSHLKWVRTHTMPYKDWQGGGLDSLRVGKLIISPPWVEAPREKDKISFKVDPGVVFGSGQHPTTRDSLQALLWIFEQEKPEKVLDLGTGTGILALAAVFLGAGQVLAIDWNPACVQSAQKNVALNQLQSVIEVKEGRAEDYIRHPADLLLANLHFAVIREVIKDKAFFEKKWIVLSGLLRSECLEVKYRLKSSPFEILKEWDAEFTWFTLLGRNRDLP
jgi:ribosomal protein L11 methyltransferase